MLGFLLSVARSIDSMAGGIDGFKERGASGDFLVMACRVSICESPVKGCRPVASS